MVSIQQELAKVLVIFRHVWGRRIPVEYSRAKADDAALAKLAIVILELPG
jgi:hypothetical protein